MNILKCSNGNGKDLFRVYFFLLHIHNEEFLMNPLFTRVTHFGYEKFPIYSFFTCRRENETKKLPVLVFRTVSETTNHQCVIRIRKTQSTVKEKNWILTFEGFSVDHFGILYFYGSINRCFGNESSGPLTFFTNEEEKTTDTLETKILKMFPIFGSYYVLPKFDCNLRIETRMYLKKFICTLQHWH